MRNLIIGIIIGLAIGGGIGYAAANYITLQDAVTGVVINSDNPLPVANF